MAFDTHDVATPVSQGQGEVVVTQLQRLFFVGETMETTMEFQDELAGNEGFSTVKHQFKQFTNP